MSQRIEDLSADELLTLIEEGAGCGCCDGQPLRTMLVEELRERLKRVPPHAASDFKVEK